MQDPGLDPAQLGAVRVLKIEGVPQSERLAVDPIDPSPSSFSTQKSSPRATIF